MNPNQRGDEEHGDKESLILDETNSQKDVKFKTDLIAGESEQDQISSSSDAETFNDKDAGETAEEVGAKPEIARNADDEIAKSCIGDDFEEFEEDDFWSNEELISSQSKRFPPPISILANESHPGLPSHMPRTFWRSMKKDGRFVLQEVQARPREFFRATRQNGRLLLQLVRPDSDSVDRMMDKFEDLQLVHREFEDKEQRTQTISGADLDVKNDEVIISRNAENILASESFATSSNSHATQISYCSEQRRNDTKEAIPAGSFGDKTGDKFRQELRLTSAFGFDNNLNLLSPSQTFLQIPFSNIQPAVW